MQAREGTRRVALEVRLLGQLDVRTTRGRSVHLGGRHAPALFALLVLSRRPRSREAIAADLWPEADATSAGSLRQALWLVRHGLSAAAVSPDTVLDIRPESIGIQPDARLDIDTVTFERCLDDGCDAGQALELYRGDLVESLGHDCFAAERERLADRYEDLLVTIARQRLAEGDLAGARHAAETLIARDPLREEAHTILIVIYGLMGSRSQVVRQYRRLQAVLDRELGEPPLPETDAAYRLALQHVLQRSLEQAAATEAELRPMLALVGS